VSNAADDLARAHRAPSALCRESSAGETSPAAVFSPDTCLMARELSLKPDVSLGGKTSEISFSLRAPEGGTQ
jgi:hypothetical protein